VAAGLDRKHEIAILIVTEECAVVRGAHSVRLLEVDSVAPAINFQRVKYGLGTRDAIHMHDPRRLRDADRQRVYVSHSRIERPIRLRVAHRLIEEFGEVVKERILVFDA
jgi:hypothetical protein